MLWVDILQTKCALDYRCSQGFPCHPAAWHHREEACNFRHAPTWMLSPLRYVVSAGTFYRDASRGVHTALSVADAAEVETSILLPHSLNAQPLVEVCQIDSCKARKVTVVTHKERGLNSFRQKIRLLFFGQFILDVRIKLHQLSSVAYGSSTTLEGPSSGSVWKEQNPTDKAGPGTVPGQLVYQALPRLQDLLLSLCHVPRSFPYSFHGIWVSSSISRDAQH